MTGGTYTLVVALSAPATIAFGAAGERDLAAGWYAYTGSALGAGGFARVDRHRDLARGEREVRHWHVDYLLCHPESAVESVVRSAGVDVECAVARDLAARLDPVAGLGASDCDCSTHLAGGSDRGRVHEAVRRSHERAR
ncbi:MAG: DUF123 domain-containing protein [Haloarculaceae archaeon]